MKTGIELIAEERARQISSEGWSAEHDDSHQEGEMAGGAVAYARFAHLQVKGHEMVPGSSGWDAAFRHWPWSSDWWKPAAQPIRNLVKAGALIAAEIDRLQRESGVQPPEPPAPEYVRPAGAGDMTSFLICFHDDRANIYREGLPLGVLQGGVFVPHRHKLPNGSERPVTIDPDLVGAVQRVVTAMAAQPPAN